MPGLRPVSHVGSLSSAGHTGRTATSPGNAEDLLGCGTVPHLVSRQMHQDHSVPDHARYFAVERPAKAASRAVRASAMRCGVVVWRNRESEILLSSGPE